MSWPVLITDRTAADVASQRSKGIYTNTDVNRVEEATEYLRDLIDVWGYKTSLTIKTDWLLQMAKLRIEYAITEQGNPARELCDSVKVYDIYGENKNTLTVSERFKFDGALTGTIKTMAIM